LDESFSEKMEIGELIFGKNHGKLSHLRNLAPKIIYGNSTWYIFSTSLLP
jgi:hypothetical protein